MSEPLNITLNGDRGLITNVPPVAVMPGYIELVFRYTDETHVIGRVKASFDFSELPPEFHAMVLHNVQQQGRQVWSMNGTAHPGGYKVLERQVRTPTAHSRPLSSWPNLWKWLTTRLGRST